MWKIQTQASKSADFLTPWRWGKEVTKCCRHHNCIVQEINDKLGGGPTGVLRTCHRLVRHGWGSEMKRTGFVAYLGLSSIFLTCSWDKHVREAKQVYKCWKCENIVNICNILNNIVWLILLLNSCGTGMAESHGKNVWETVVKSHQRYVNICAFNRPRGFSKGQTRPIWRFKTVHTAAAVWGSLHVVERQSKHSGLLVW